MGKYGIPYMGSKSGLAEAIIDFLPAGERLCDLCGGGFAISHCALTTNKYRKVLYNEIDPLVVGLIQKALNGDYDYSVFKPKFITREDFECLANRDGYIKYIWSFGNTGKGYLFGKGVEQDKQAMHDAVVFNDITPRFLQIAPAFKGWDSDEITARRMQLKKIMREQAKRCDMEPLERLERLHALGRLEHLERIERMNDMEVPLDRLEITCGSYEDYVYQEGDVVYVDPPYENTTGYSKDGFDHKKFYEWVHTRPYRVFFSSYDISDKGFYVVWKKERPTFLGQGRGDTTEFIYSNQE